MRAINLFADASIERRVWKLAIGLSAFILTAIGVMTVSVPALYSGRLSRDAARMAVIISDEAGDAGEASEPPPEAIARWQHSTGDIDLAYVDVIIMGVIDSSAPPPPGIHQWPEPGEVFLSPALMQRASHGEFAGQFGQLKGVIDEAALADPGERLVYVGADPTRMDTDASPFISGFGVSTMGNGHHLGFIGTTMYQEPSRVFTEGLLLFGWAPTFALMIVAVTLDGERRHNRLFLIRQLGADPASIRLAIVKEVGFPATVGAGAMVVLSGVAMVGTWWIPGLHFAVVGSDLRAARWHIVMVGIICIALITLTGLYVFRDTKAHTLGARPIPRSRPVRRWPVIVSFLVVAATNLGWYEFHASNVGLAITIMVVGAAAAVILSPTVTALVIRRCGGFIARQTRESGKSAPLLIAAREIESLSRPVMRATAGMCIVSIIALAAFVWRNTATEPFVQGTEFHRFNAGITARTSSIPPRHLETIRDTLAASTATLVIPSGVWSDDGWEPTALLGTCAQLVEVVGTCDGGVPEQPPIPQFLLWAPPGTPVVTDTGLETLEFVQDVIFVSLQGLPLDRYTIGRTITDTLGYPLQVQWPDQAWLVGMRNHADQSRWIGAGGLLALSIALATAMLGLTFEVIRVARRAAPLGNLTAHHAFYLQLSLGVIGLPIAIAGAVGLVTGVALQLASTGPTGAAVMPWALTGQLGGAILLFGVASSLVSSVLVRRVALQRGHL
ncbi:MAG: hypothetical protein LBH13_01915 [Cellulomonadaceae bacterium]|jgi:hypothetical protein|nr:hypothetical protein [Cellulomonadaceae bacterium]